MSYELVILDGPQAGRRLAVGETPVILGRATDIDLPFPEDNFISGRHVTLRSTPQGVSVIDLRSTNGTFLNGQRITQVVAEVGDTLQIGTMTLQVTVAPLAQKPAVPTAVPSAPQPQVPSSSGVVPGFQLPAMNIPAPPPLGATTTIPTIAVGLPPGGLPLKTVRRPVEEAVPEVLAGIRAPVFVMVNTEASETIAPFLQAGVPNLQQYAIWEGEPATIPSWVPYLLPVTPQASWLRPLLKQGWDQGFLSFLVSSAPVAEVQKHFARFLFVQLGSSEGLYFRFYDPVVMRDFMPTATPGELAMFFGPVSEWLLEGEAPGTLLRVKSAPGGLVTNSTVAL